MTYEDEVKEPLGNYEFMLEINKRCRNSSSEEWQTWLLEQLITHRVYLNWLLNGDI